VLEQAVVHEVLVDRGELVFELGLQGLDDFGIAFNARAPVNIDGSL
jgi:hypothetical protein